MAKNATGVLGQEGCACIKHAWCPGCSPTHYKILNYLSSPGRTQSTFGGLQLSTIVLFQQSGPSCVRAA
jgi:hypothetical protein